MFWHGRIPAGAHALLVALHVTLRVALVVGLPVGTMSIGGTVIAQAPPAAVWVETVEAAELQARRRVTGEFRAVARSRVAARERGIVLERRVHEGDRVAAGDVLAMLDDRRVVLERGELLARRAVAEATVRIRIAERDKTAQERDRLTSLTARGAANPKELEDATSDFEIAQSELGAAEEDGRVIAAQLERLEQRQADMSITAPFAGTVITTLVDAGEWIAEGSAVVEILATGAVEAWLDVPQRDAPSVLAPTATVEIETADGRRWPALAPNVVRTVDRASRSFPVYVHLEDASETLLPGMSIVGWVPTGARGEHLLVSRDAILRNSQGPFVYVVRPSPDGPSTVMPVSIEPMFTYGQSMAVAPGRLQVGDVIVVEGNERLYPTAAVVPTPRPGAEERTSDGGAAPEGTAP